MLSEVDGARRTLKSYDGRETDYDLLVTIPAHGGAEVIDRSGLGDASGWLPTHKHTLQSLHYPNVFALGDATDLPSSKAGSVAHFQSEVLLENMLRFAAGQRALCRLRRPRELLHRDRLRQGHADRFQLHDGAAAGALPAAGGGALRAARGERRQPLGQARLQVGLLERAAGRKRDAARPPHADGRQSGADHGDPLSPPNPRPPIASSSASTPSPLNLDALTAQVAYLVERQKKQEELFAEMTPILKEVMDAATERLDDAGEEGLFRVRTRGCSASASASSRASRPDDVRQLGDAIVSILDTVRALTQPEVLAIADEASRALSQAHQAEPIGLTGLIRASRDDEVQRGMATMMDLLRHVGRAAQAVPASSARRRRDRRARLAEVTGGPAPLAPAPSAPRPGPPPPGSPRTGPAPPPAACAVAPVQGTRVAAVHRRRRLHRRRPPRRSAAWTEALAEHLADAQAVPLTDAHWAVIRFARADFEKTRRLPTSAASPRARASRPATSTPSSPRPPPAPSPRSRASPSPLAASEPIKSHSMSHERRRPHRPVAPQGRPHLLPRRPRRGLPVAHPRQRRAPVWHRRVCVLHLLGPRRHHRVKGRSPPRQHGRQRQLRACRPCSPASPAWRASPRR